MAKPVHESLSLYIYLSVCVYIYIYIHVYIYVWQNPYMNVIRPEDVVDPSPKMLKALELSISTHPNNTVEF